MTFFWLLGKKFWSFRFSRFVAVGTLNTFIDFFIVNLLAYIFGAYAGKILMAINTVSFCTVVTISFFLNKKITFKRSFGDRRLVKKQYLLFFVSSLIGLFLNNLIVYLLTTAIGPRYGLSDTLWLNFSKALAVGVVLFWNYFNYKYLVFRSNH